MRFQIYLRMQPLDFGDILYKNNNNKNQAIPPIENIFTSLNLTSKTCGYNGVLLP